MTEELFPKSSLKIKMKTSGNKKYGKEVDLPMRFASEIDEVSFEARAREITLYVKDGERRRLMVTVDIDYDLYLNTILSGWIFAITPDSIHPPESSLEDYTFDPTKPMRIQLKLRENILEKLLSQVPEQGIVGYVQKVLQEENTEFPLLDTTSYQYLAVMQEQVHISVPGTFLSGYASAWGKEWPAVRTS